MKRVSGELSNSKEGYSAAMQKVEELQMKLQEKEKECGEERVKVGKAEKRCEELLKESAELNDALEDYKARNASLVSSSSSTCVPPFSASFCCTLTRRKRCRALLKPLNRCNHNIKKANKW